jgi:hypothetical protein
MPPPTYRECINLISGPLRNSKLNSIIEKKFVGPHTRRPALSSSPSLAQASSVGC